MKPSHIKLFCINMLCLTLYKIDYALGLVQKCREFSPFLKRHAPSNSQFSVTNLLVCLVFWQNNYLLQNVTVLWPSILHFLGGLVYSAKIDAKLVTACSFQVMVMFLSATEFCLYKPVSLSAPNQLLPSTVA